MKTRKILHTIVIVISLRLFKINMVNISMNCHFIRHLNSKVEVFKVLRRDEGSRRTRSLPTHGLITDGQEYNVNVRLTLSNLEFVKVSRKIIDVRFYSTRETHQGTYWHKDGPSKAYIELQPH